MIAGADDRLGERLREGDEAALALLYDRYMPGIYDFLARLVRDRFAAEDLTQATFVRAWERRATLRDAAKVRPWLYAIAHNLARNHVTRTPPPEPFEEQLNIAAGGPGPEEEVAGREAAELVWAAAASLEPRQHAVLDLSVRHGLSTPEVAQVMGVSVGHAAVLVNRAREALGNAVRYLLVARRRDHCERLAALVPAGVRALTPAQRSAVDHHMRRCSTCQSLARRLTSPAELFGGLVALPVPASLQGERRDSVLAAARHRQGLAGSSDVRRPPTQPVRVKAEGEKGWRISRRAVAAAGFALLAVSTGLFALHQASGPGSAAAARPSTSPVAAAGGSSSPATSPAAASPAVPAATSAAGTGQQQPPPAPARSPSPSPPPSFAVDRVTVTATDPTGTGCPRTSLGYLCHFTVVVAVRNPGPGAVVTGTLTAAARGLGGTPVETKTSSFSATAQAGSATTSAALGVLFNSAPCASQGNGAPHSIASAATDHPHAVTSGEVAFGATCVG